MRIGNRVGGRGRHLTLDSLPNYVISLDVKVPMDWSTFPPTSGKVVCANPLRLRELYRRQLAVPGYKRLLEKNLTIFGTFDGELP